MVAVMLAGVMFPLWPAKLKVGVWYLSVAALGLVGAFIVLAIVRLIFWCFTKIFMAKAIWMFPNLFEDVGFVSYTQEVTDSRSTRSFLSGLGMSQRRRSFARLERSVPRRRRRRPLLLVLEALSLRLRVLPTLPVLLLKPPLHLPRQLPLPTLESLPAPRFLLLSVTGVRRLSKTPRSRLLPSLKSSHNALTLYLMHCVGPYVPFVGHRPSGSSSTSLLLIANRIAHNNNPKNNPTVVVNILIRAGLQYEVTRHSSARSPHHHLCFGHLLH